MVELIQAAYDRDDDEDANRLAKRLAKEDETNQRTENRNRYMAEEESSKSSDDDADIQAILVEKRPPRAPSVTVLREAIVPNPIRPSDRQPLANTGKEGKELSNGDMIHNGRIFKNGPAKMGDAITPLSPHLTLKLKHLKSFIPLPVFDEEFLLKDQMAWSMLPPKSEDKAEKEKRLYGGEGPKEELTMDFEAWSDCMELMCVHLRDQDWGPVAERFESHMVIVKQLRKDFGWMVALRYCRRTNPYAEGGPKANICPYTNQLKSTKPSSSSTTTPYVHNNTINRHASGSTYRGNGGGRRGRGYQPWN